MPLEGGRGPGGYLPGGDGADELADGLGRQAQHRADLAVGPALGDQVVNRGVTFPGPYRQAAITGILARGRPGRLSGNAAPGRGGLRIGGAGGFLQVSAAGDDGLLHRVAQVLPQVEAVRHLDRIRCSLPGAL